MSSCNKMLTKKQLRQFLKNLCNTGLGLHHRIACKNLDEILHTKNCDNEYNVYQTNQFLKQMMSIQNVGPKCDKTLCGTGL